MAYSNYPSNIMGYPKTSVPDTYSDVVLSGTLKNSGIATYTSPINPTNYYAYSSASTRVQVGKNIYSIPANTLTKIPITSVSTQQPFLSISDSTFTYVINSTSSISSNNRNKVDYGNGIFYSINNGSASELSAISKDGLYWINISNPPQEGTSYGPNSINFVNNKWVRGARNLNAVDAHSLISISTDLVSWTTATLTTSTQWFSTSVAYGNGKYVGVGVTGSGSIINNTSILSTDGITWTASTNLPAQAYWSSVTFGNGLFVATCYGVNGYNNNSTVVATSTDGLTWTSRTIASEKWSNAIYANSLFVASSSGEGQSSNIYATSTDGITWTSRTLPSSIWQYNGFSYGNGWFLINNAYGNNIFYSTDAITWTSSTIPLTKYWSTNTYGNGIFVITGQSQDSINAIQIKNVTSPSTPIQFSIYSGPKDVY